MDEGFYKYIYEHNDGYQIIKDNENYGTYRKLTDALYERDRLIKTDWDIVLSAEIEETENFYEKMQLPKFLHSHDFIYVVHNTFLVYKDDELRGRFNTKTDAYAYADEIDGEVCPTNPRYRIQKSINGKQKSFGQYGSLEEAQRQRDRLIKRKWRK